MNFLDFSQSVHDALRARGANVTPDGFGDATRLHLDDDRVFLIIESGNSQTYNVSVTSHTLSAQMATSNPDSIATAILALV